MCTVSLHEIVISVAENRLWKETEEQFDHSSNSVDSHFTKQHGGPVKSDTVIQLLLYLYQFDLRSALPEDSLLFEALWRINEHPAEVSQELRSVALLALAQHFERDVEDLIWIAEIHFLKRNKLHVKGSGEVVLNLEPKKNSKKLKLKLRDNK